jgi:hypothetical protein
MRVELALFQGDDLPDRGNIWVSSEPRTASFDLFQAHHRLIGDAADIVLDSFSDAVGLKRVTLDMPVHESEDRESIELAS